MVSLADVRQAVGTSDELIESLYGELRTIAHREHGRSGNARTLQTTALINEAYLKLHRRDGWESQSQFLGHAATAIRHVLIDAARARLSAKRGGGEQPVAADTSEDRELVALGDALKALAEQDADLAKLVDCRFFAGLDEAETAQVLGVSDRTVRRWWIQARAWIHREMTAG